MTVTKEWLRQQIAAMEAARDDIPLGLNEDGTKTLEALKMLLAGMESEPLAVQNFRSAMEGIGHIRRTLDETFGGLHGTHCEPDVLVECKAICDSICEAYRRTAPPAPVAVPDEREAFEAFMEEKFKDSIDRKRVLNGDQGYFAWDMIVAWIVWQGRAAMLKASVTGYLRENGNSSTEKFRESTETSTDERRQRRDLVMMVKMLCRTVKKYNATSQQATDYMEYLQREGLISASDCLRGDAKDAE